MAEHALRDLAEVCFGDLAEVCFANSLGSTLVIPWRLAHTLRTTGVSPVPYLSYLWLRSASRLESACPSPGAIHISAAVHEELLECARVRARKEQQQQQQQDGQRAWGPPFGQQEAMSCAEGQGVGKERAQVQQHQHQQRPQEAHHHWLRYKRKRQQQREGRDSSASDVDMEQSVTLHKLPQVPDAPAAEPASCCDAFHSTHVSTSFRPSHLSSQHLTADTLGAWTGSSAAEPAVYSRDSFDGFSFGLNSQGGRSRRASQASQYSARLNLPPAAAQPGPGALSHKDLHMPGHGGSGSSGASGTSGALAAMRGRSGLEHPSWVGSVAWAHLSQARGSRHSQNLDNVDAQDDVVTVWSPHSRVGSGSARLVAVSLQGSFDAEAAETSSVEAVASGASGFDADTPAHLSCDHHDVAAALPGLEAWQYRGETELKGRVATLESYVLQVVQPNVRVRA